MAMKGVYKRGGIYWIRYTSFDGKVIRESSKSSKVKDAEALLLQRKQAIREGKFPELKKISNCTFDELISQYLQWAERQRCFRSKKGFIRQLMDAFGNLPLRVFNTMLIEQFQTERLQKGNKPATVNRLLATLKHMFTKAFDWNLIGEETLKCIKRVKLLPENNKRLRYLSKEECQALINACDAHLKPIVVTALNTGMRKGEILSLRWDNIDFKHNFILLDVTKNGERREIPINETLRGVLQGLTRRLDIPYIFYDKATGKPYQDIKRSFNTALRKAGIKDFHFHDLRHTFASHLVMAGVDITTVSRLLGHKSLTMTLRYSHLAPEHMSKAVDILDTVINRKPISTKLAQFGG
jgi:integrase